MCPRNPAFNDFNTCAPLLIKTQLKGLTTAGETGEAHFSRAPLH
jgi:hypothetical protein